MGGGGGEGGVKKSKIEFWYKATVELVKSPF